MSWIYHNAPWYREAQEAAMNGGRKALQPWAHAVLQAWMDGGARDDDKALDGCTFGNIVAYKAGRPVAEDRLMVALGDVGCTPEELEKRSAKELAQEVLALGIASDSSDDE